VEKCVSTMHYPLWRNKVAVWLRLPSDRTKNSRIFGCKQQPHSRNRFAV